MRRHALTTLHVTLVGLGCLAACGGDDGGSAADAGVDAIVGGAQAPFPRLACPGDPGCESTGDGTLRAAAARVDITPELAGKDRGWQDEDGDHVYDEAEPFEDVDGDGVFDAVWIAGSQNARPATGVHDPLWARVMVLDQGDVRVAVVVYDLIGWFIDDMERTRALLGPELGLDHVIFASTHSHQSPDTMGLWGPTSLASGVDPAYMERVRTRTALALREAVAALEPVHVRVATTPTLDGTGLARPYLADLRDPVVLDPTLTIVHLTSAAEPGRTIGSLVHWSSHPEYVGFDNNLLSSDIVHYIRATIEDGAPATAAGGAAPGLGGVAVYLQGVLGGQIGPWGARPIAADGSEVADASFAKAEAAGTNVGRLALEALGRPGDFHDVPDPRLAFRTGDLLLRVENVFYHVGALAGVLDRDFVGLDPERPIDDDNMPYVRSRVSYLELGPIAIVTAPGELHPELFVGGYDGSWSFGVPIVAADNPNPPDLATAPPPPYLRDLMDQQPGIEFPMVLGLAEDTVGYILPRWNFELSASAPYLEEASGDHYEETNSVGPTCEAEIVGPMGQLVTWRRP